MGQPLAVHGAKHGAIHVAKHGVRDVRMENGMEHLARSRPAGAPASVGAFDRARTNRARERMAALREWDYGATSTSSRVRHHEYVITSTSDAPKGNKYDGGSLCTSAACVRQRMSPPALPTSFQAHHTP